MICKKGDNVARVMQYQKRCLQQLKGVVRSCLNIVTRVLAYRLHTLDAPALQVPAMRYVNSNRRAKRSGSSALWIRDDLTENDGSQELTVRWNSAPLMRNC